MSPRRAVVGIDPSGGRLALAARGAPIGPAVSPAVVPLRHDREPALFDEAEKVLLDFVARHGMAGSAARLCIPAERVYIARVAFPALKERDLGSALENELERLFPFPASRLLFGWRRLGKKAPGGAVPLVVAAAPSDYVAKWRETISRAGLVLTGAVPVAWALSAAVTGAAKGPGIAAILRGSGGDVECTLLTGREPFFCSVRRNDGKSRPADALALIAAGLSDAAPRDIPVRLVAPDDLLGEVAALGGEAGMALKPAEDFVAQAGEALGLFPEGDGGGRVFDLLGAWGAATGRDGIDVLQQTGNGASRRLIGAVAAFLAATAVLLAAAWPAAVYWKTGRELRRLDGEVAALRPQVEGVEAALAKLADVEARILLMSQAAEGREMALTVLHELTERLPEGTWLTTLRVEDGKFEMGGISSSASALFPLLTRAGTFRDVEFASPITRQPDNLERFQIRAGIAPVPEKTGEAAR